MSCIFESYVKATLILGVSYFTLNLLELSGMIIAIIMKYQDIIELPLPVIVAFGLNFIIIIFGTLSGGLLIFGAQRKKSTPILIWIIFSIIQCVTCIGVAFSTHRYGSHNNNIDEFSSLTLNLVGLTVTILLNILIIIVAIYARREIVKVDAKGCQEKYKKFDFVDWYFFN